MRIIYDLGIRLYYLGILISSPFNAKARAWIIGRRGLLKRLADQIDPSASYIWFHCSSLGEFEQGRPLMEELKQRRPGAKILLTFFSPSGYEVRKNYPGADVIAYLPLDTARNARRFLRLLPIERAYFVKYEFWYHLLKGLRTRKIPSYLVSGIFRRNQVFFRWYGSWYRRILTSFDHLFVQQERSIRLLQNIGITHATACGDTRFDRVAGIAASVKTDPAFLKFCGKHAVIVAGSTWPADEKLLVHYMNTSGRELRWIIAPHEIHESGIRRLMEQVKRKAARYTRVDGTDWSSLEVLIIDTIGMLSSLYQYATLCYIGGGFGKGIHNTLEAATFGKPVVFGPRYRNFREAVDLVDRRAAFPVRDEQSCADIFDALISDRMQHERACRAATEYVQSMQGATDFILERTSFS